MHPRNKDRSTAGRVIEPRFDPLEPHSLGGAYRAETFHFEALRLLQYTLIPQKQRFVFLRFQFLQSLARSLPEKLANALVAPFVTTKEVRKSLGSCRCMFGGEKIAA